jgi:hypothetical protein
MHGAAVEPEPNFVFKLKLFIEIYSYCLVKNL